jgi:NADP-dependent 3-hydroxy acid dehydrogenase YdfG
VTVELKDKIAVITGAGSGIGRATALGLASKGVRLCLLGRDGEKLNQTAATIGKRSPRVRYYRVDLLNDDDIREVERKIKIEFSRVDILIHSAGSIRLDPPSIAPIEDFDLQYRTNVRAPLLLTQMMVPLMVPQEAQIVFINSSAAMNPGIDNGFYAATKSALQVVAGSLRQELNSRGIRVLSVYLGRTASPMQEMIFRIENREYRPERLIQPEDVATLIVESLSLPLTAEVTDIHVRPFYKL